MDVLNLTLALLAVLVSIWSVRFSKAAADSSEASAVEARRANHETTRPKPTFKAYLNEHNLLEVEVWFDRALDEVRFESTWNSSHAGQVNGIRPGNSSISRVHRVADAVNAHRCLVAREVQAAEPLRIAASPPAGKPPPTARMLLRCVCLLNDETWDVPLDTGDVEVPRGWSRPGLS